MVTQIPGGILAEKYGGKYVLGLGILLTDFFCVLTPLAARQGGANAVIVMRVLTGLAEVSFKSREILKSILLTQQLACLLQGSVVSCGQQYDFQMGSYF